MSARPTRSTCVLAYFPSRANNTRRTSVSRRTNARAQGAEAERSGESFPITEVRLWLRVLFAHVFVSTSLLEFFVRRIVRHADAVQVRRLWRGRAFITGRRGSWRAFSDPALACFFLGRSSAFPLGGRHLAPLAGRSPARIEDVRKTNAPIPRANAIAPFLSQRAE